MNRDRRIRTPWTRQAPAAVAAACLCNSAPALALSCDEVVEMLEAGFDAGVVAETVQAEGKAVDGGGAACLERRGAPTAVVDAARAVGRAQASSSTAHHPFNESAAHPRRAAGLRVPLSAARLQITKSTAVKKCLLVHRRDHQRLPPRLDLRVFVEADGQVSRIRTLTASVQGTDLEPCLNYALRNLAFLAPGQPRSVLVDLQLAAPTPQQALREAPASENIPREAARKKRKAEPELVARTGVGGGLGPSNGAYAHLQAKSSSDLQVVETQSWTSASQGAGTTWEVSAGLRLYSLFEVSVLGGVLGGDYTVQSWSVTEGQELNEPEPLRTPNRVTHLGPQVLLRIPTAGRIRPVVGAEHRTWFCKGVRDHVDAAALPQDAPTFTGQRLGSLGVRGGGEIGMTRWLDLFVHGQVSTIVSGTTIERKTSGGGVLPDQGVGQPATMNPWGASLVVGVQAHGFVRQTE